MDTDERRLLRWQVAGSWVAPFVAAAVTIATLWFTIRSDIQAEARAAERQAAADGARLLSETGSVGECEATVVLLQEWPTAYDEPLFGGSGGFVDYPGAGSASPSNVATFENLFRNICARRAEQPPSIVVQRELVRQLTEHPEQRAEILAMWRAIYEADAWIDPIERSLEDV